MFLCISDHGDCIDSTRRAVYSPLHKGQRGNKSRMKGRPMANKHARLGPAIFDVSVFHGIAGESIPYNDYVGCEIYWGGGGYSQRKLWLQATSEGYYWKGYSKQEKRKENSFMTLLRIEGKRI